MQQDKQIAKTAQVGSCAGQDGRRTAELWQELARGHAAAAKYGQSSEALWRDRRGKLRASVCKRPSGKYYVCQNFGILTLS